MKMLDKLIKKLEPYFGITEKFLEIYNMILDFIIIATIIFFLIKHTSNFTDEQVVAFAMIFFILLKLINIEHEIRDFRRNMTRIFNGDTTVNVHELNIKTVEFSDIKEEEKVND